MIRKFIYIINLSLVLPFTGFGQNQSSVVYLWKNGAPGFENRKDIPEEAKDYWVKSINNPSITIFLPAKEKANGCAVVVAPGGGFRELVYNAEGIQTAEFLNSIGVAAFVLKYRLPNEENSPYTMENVKQDAYRAIRLVRQNAETYGIDRNRVGMLGFSAGGAVVMLVAFDKGDGNPSAFDPIDRQNGRPSFEMMVYPGGNPPATIPADAPPAFLICANDDEYGCDEVTMELLQKFRASRVPVEAIFFARGKHAFNMGDRSPYSAVKHWPQRMAEWLGDSGFLSPGFH